MFLEGKSLNAEKYRPFVGVEMTDRKWPTRVQSKPPIWCSVDLRDGNQALPEPMSLDSKLAFFAELTRIGFKEIEVGFPSASQTEYDTVRALIEENLIPEDVTIQVLVQAREHLIDRTLDAIRGAKHVIVHLYSNTSPLHRRVVFGMDKKETLELAVKGARMIVEKTREIPGIRYEYSPESFSATEPEYSVEVLTRMLDAFEATEERPLILNLPTTTEICTPNRFADLVEYVWSRVPGRERAILSIHPHNDRGTGVADAEMACLAGAQRVEGTLFGNGERTGNVDIVTLALNLYTQGVDPGLDFSRMNDVKEVYETATGMRVHERSPYAGDLVFTAFSGSHQDAIRKGLAWRSREKEKIWEVPYLIVDPADLGREWEPIVRINSQSGKGGAAFVLQERYGFQLPRAMHPEFGLLVKKTADKAGAELSAEDVFRLFVREYLEVNAPYRLKSHEITETGGDGHSAVRFSGVIESDKEAHTISGEGNGPIDAFFSAMRGEHLTGFAFSSYHEHAISSGSDAKAAAYIELTYRGHGVFGVGLENNVSIASIKGVLCAVNRAINLYGE